MLVARVRPPGAGSGGRGPPECVESWAGAVEPPRSERLDDVLVAAPDVDRDLVVAAREPPRRQRRPVRMPGRNLLGRVVLDRPRAALDGDPDGRRPRERDGDPERPLPGAAE